jgi:hypothetical protein
MIALEEGLEAQRARMGSKGSKSRAFRASISEHCVEDGAFLLLALYRKKSGGWCASTPSSGHAYSTPKAKNIFDVNASSGKRGIEKSG